jgi:DNA replication and repair protein RecF
MHLASLQLRDFRNLEEQRLSFPPQGVAIIGDNGQGKTNLLEAIYYLEIFRSFRGAPDEQLVRFGGEVFRAEGAVEGGDMPVSIAAAFDRRRRKKKVTLDGAEPERLGDALGRLGAVVFSPSDVLLVAGSPSLRRRYLDIVLSLAVPSYLGALQRFRQALAQRNALLRQGAPVAQVTAWDDGLVAWGSRVTATRAHWVGEHAADFARHYAEIAGGAAGRLEYEVSIGEANADDELRERYRRELRRVADREARRGMTLIGPHRDDLAVSAQGAAGGGCIDLRVFGSGGQQRTAAVALRMIEADTIQATRGRDPILLLDDVFAELDPGRSRRILEWIEREEAGQVILTAPKPADFELRGGTLARWRISAGRIQEL